MVSQVQSRPQEDFYETVPQQFLGGVSESNSNTPSLLAPQTGTVYQQSDDPFLKWLLDHKQRTIEPWKKSLQGLEWSNEISRWVPIGGLQIPISIMNTAGIVWATSLLESYFNPVFLTTNMSVRNYNFRMRTCARFIIMTLCERYKEFDLLPSNIDRVGEEIESKISALLAGAINDGYRRMIITQVHINEQRMYGPQPQASGGIQSIFSRNTGQPQPTGGY